ncbi:hypothetical protein CEXT_677181 [Caerostris extrusa]|uniref:Uncharacterized protein n=1 Tax=Caerostris extrusa TaxID=172846 RepID=A0AAV4NIM7_CAEEX|nr:hypothetical protein CEXT_677181 [Caerostris extrusa]
MAQPTNVAAQLRISSITVLTCYVRNSSITRSPRRRVAHQELVRLKRMFEFTDNDDVILIASKRIKRTPDNHTKPKYDLDLSPDHMSPAL